MRLLEMVAHRGQQRHRRRLDQLGGGAGALDGQRFRARHDGGGLEISRRRRRRATAGSGTAYTLSSFQVFDTLAHHLRQSVQPHLDHSSARARSVGASAAVADVGASSSCC